ncbi:MAG TPA: OmpA family protein [Rhodocyclaceae bacterium]|nr:OmpA family protein [Rhodocyclaceae bacterium]
MTTMAGDVALLRRRMMRAGSCALALTLGLAGCAAWQPPAAPAAGRSGAAVAGTGGAVPVQAKSARQRIGAAQDGTGAAADDAADGTIEEFVPPLDYAHNVYFPLGSHALGSEAMAALKRHARRLNGNARLVVTLIGHTDDLGSREYNDALCLKRAKAVEQALLELGVSPRQIRIASRYGYEKSPAKPCRTEACRRALRRVELRYPS